MLRLWLSVSVLFLMAACASAPPTQQGGMRSAGTRSPVPRAFAPPAGFPNFVDHSVGREEISIQAMSLVGVPYRWGGNTPDGGFDCSGFVRYVVSRSAQIDLPRTTADMSERGVSIDPEQIATGDLVFFNTTGRPHSHVGIYVGKLRFINAPSTGGTVRLDYLSNPYWAKHFDGIRRVAAPQNTAPSRPFDTPVYEARGVPAQSSSRIASAVGMTGGAAAANGMTRQPVAAASESRQPSVVAGAAAMPQEGSAANDTALAPAAPATASVASTAPVQRLPEQAATRMPTARSADAPDAIAAAADAFEPPPPTAAGAALQAQSVESGHLAASADASAANDPIASFARTTY